MLRDRGRATIYGMAGFYLLYLAYQMFGARADNNGSNYWMMVIFSVLFVIIGGGICFFSVSILRKCAKEQREILEEAKRSQSGETVQKETVQKETDQPTENAQEQKQKQNE